MITGRLKGDTYDLWLKDAIHLAHAPRLAAGNTVGYREGFLVCVKFSYFPILLYSYHMAMGTLAALVEANS